MTTTPIPPPASAQPQKSSGCLKYGLLGCGALVALLAILCAVVLAVVLGWFKSTAVYKQARDRVVHDRRVISELGAPVEAGFLVWGTMHVDNRNGSAEINFPVSGPKGKGVVRAEATLDQGGWHYSQLRVEREQGPTIDLLRSP